MKNVCGVDHNNLDEITIKDLKTGKVSNNCILWVKTVTKASFGATVVLIVADKKEQVMMLELYNSLPFDTKLEQIQKEFPENLQIGIKNPYKRLTYNGFIALRNDNPQNLVIGGQNNSTPESLKAEGN